VYRQLVQIGSTNGNLHYYLGTVLRSQGKIDAADSSFKRAIEYSPDHKEALQSLGLIYLTQSKYSDALPHFQKAMEVDSTFYPAWVTTGVCLAMTDQMAKADTLHLDLIAKDSIMADQMILLISQAMAKREARKKAGR
ncbi:MAG: tetratricopeptide repeat protein, partial [candidate division Zixibacteria bacterium]